MFVFIPCLFAFALLGCAESNTLDAEGTTGRADTGVEASDSDTANGSDSADEALVPAWYSLQGTVQVLGGGADLAGARVHFLLADAELAVEACEDLDLTELAVAATPVGEVAMYAWWELTIPADHGCPATVGLPRRIGFGIGELSPEVRARLGTVDLEDSADDLYGAWLQADGDDADDAFDDAEPFPFGYALGDGTAAGDQPPADGAYALEPLLVLELPPQA